MTTTMQRPAPQELDAATLTIAEEHGRLVATFFTADGDETGYTPHLVERTEAEVVAHYEARGWELVSRGWLLWSPDGTLASVIESERPVTRAHLEQRITADHDMPTGTLQPVPDAALPAVRAAWQRAVDQGQHITPDDIAKLTTQEA